MLMMQELLEMLTRAWPLATREMLERIPPELVVIDCETTGLDERTCGLLEVAALHPRTGDMFYELVDPRPCEIEDAALLANGYTREMLADPGRLSPESVTGLLATWCRVRVGPELAVVVGRNPRFDMAFLGRCVPKLEPEERERWGRLWHHQLADTHGGVIPWAVGRGLPLRGGLKYAYRSLQVMDEPKPHRALRGAVQALAGFLALVRESEETEKRRKRT